MCVLIYERKTDFGLWGMSQTNTFVQRSRYIQDMNTRYVGFSNKKIFKWIKVFKKKEME